MSDPKTADERVLSKTLLLALKDCVEWGRHQPYIWKPKSMAKLEKLGFVHRQERIFCGKISYRPTVAGGEYLASHYEF